MDEAKPRTNDTPCCAHLFRGVRSRGLLRNCWNLPGSLAVQRLWKLGLHPKQAAQYLFNLEAAAHRQTQDEACTASNGLQCSEVGTECGAGILGSSGSRKHNTLRAQVEELEGYRFQVETSHEVASMHIKQNNALHAQLTEAREVNGNLVAALREARCWVPNGSRQTPEQRGAACRNHRRSPGADGYRYQSERTPPLSAPNQRESPNG